MLIVGKNLEQLIQQHRMVDRSSSFDENSICLALDRELIVLEPPNDGAEITYGHTIPEEWIKRRRMPDSGFLLRPGSAVLACSHEIVAIPQGYFGLLQTKGSLARLFVSVNCADGQVEAGFKGKVTFEITNSASFAVRLLPLQAVAQLFVLKTSTRLAEPYNGRYQNPGGPTFQLPADGASSFTPV